MKKMLVPNKSWYKSLINEKILNDSSKQAENYSNNGGFMKKNHKLLKLLVQILITILKTLYFHC